MMMFTLLQDQHKAQLKLMEADNKLAMDMMFEHMNVLIAGHGKAADKVTAPLANSNTDSTPITTRGFTNCGKFIFHKPASCYKLKTNANKHYPGWKLSKIASAPT